MSPASVLVIDGNRAATREQQVAAGGSPTGEAYARTLERLAAVRCDIVRPADGEVHFPQAAGLHGYDGVAITGSALNVYDGGAHIERQIELARATFAAGVPFFGSCWGMQVAVSAAGGLVRPNPLGREFGFARRIELSEAGRRHPMFSGKPAVFEAITVHRDDITELPKGAVVLASNDMGLQAVELRVGPGSFWGVQYHPEYSFDEIAATARRYGAKLIEEGLFADPAELEGLVQDLHALMRNPRDRRLAWKHGLGPAVQDEELKLAELRNWLEHQVLPYARQRGAAAAKDRP
jgi:GMP synthase (glutamine-hydrolysing)